MPELIAILGAFGVLLALLLSGHLAISPGGRGAVRWLIILILTGLSIRIGKSVFNHYLDIEPWQRNVGLAGLLLVGPGFLLLARAIGNVRLHLTAACWVHFVPAFGFAAFSGLIPNRYDLLSYMSYWAVMLHWVGYLVAARLVRRDSQALPATDRHWFVGFEIGLWLLWTYYAAVSIGWVPFYIGGALVYSALIIGLTLALLHSSRLFQRRYETSTLSSAESVECLARIDRWMSQTRAFLTPGLTLNCVATELKLPPRVVSQAINAESGCNFSEYVNRYRVAQAQRLLAHPEHAGRKLFAIAIDCGFGNITSFNAAFKASMAMTPSAFRKRAKKPASP